MSEKEILTLICTRESFRPVKSSVWVRWLALNADIYRMQRFRLECGSPSIEYAEWEEWHRQGYRFCGAMIKNVMVAQAAVLQHNETEWELAAVRTLEKYQRQGYGKAVCSFATDAILAALPQAACHVRADNIPMLRLAQYLGYLIK